MNRWLFTSGSRSITHIRITWEAFETTDAWAYPGMRENTTLEVESSQACIFQKLPVTYLKAGLKIAVLYNPIHTPGIYYLPAVLYINHFSVHLIKGAKIWYSPKS